MAKKIDRVIPISVVFDNEKLFDVINDTLVTEIKCVIREEDRRERGVINQYIKEMLYANKDEIIEKIVERASREMVKKGLPKLLEKMEK